MDPGQLHDVVVQRAHALGFVAVGVTGTEPFPDARRRGLDAVAAGRMDGMPWFDVERVIGASDPAARHRWARSIVALAWPYRPATTPGAAPPGWEGGRRGRFSAYVCVEDDGRPTDYHTLIGGRIDALVSSIREHVPGVRAKSFIDHGWATDRAIAERAGIGFCGKHAGVLTPQAGSYVLLGAVLLSVELPRDEPTKRACGTCRACLPACPTGAIIAPGVIDARRCISYLTIEHDGPIPVALRPLMGAWAFGCDLCQEACPVNVRRAPAALPPGPGTTRHGPVPFPDLVEVLDLDDAEFASRFRGTPLQRAGRARLARNAAIALGNSADRGVLPALLQASALDPDPVVRDAAAWAVHQVGSRPHAAVPRPAR